jgi:hypothetical protein
MRPQVLSQPNSQLRSQPTTHCRAQGISASASGAVITLFAPSSLNPNAVWDCWYGRVHRRRHGDRDHNPLGYSYVYFCHQRDRLAGTSPQGDTVTLTMTSSAIAGSPVNVAYTVSAGDTAASIAANLAAAINSNSTLSAAGIKASSSSGIVTLAAPSLAESVSPSGRPAASSSGGGTAAETVALSSALAFNGLMTYAVLTQQQQVSGASANQAFLSAVSNIYNQSQLILSEKLVLSCAQSGLFHPAQRFERHFTRRSTRPSDIRDKRNGWGHAHNRRPDNSYYDPSGGRWFCDKHDLLSCR